MEMETTERLARQVRKTGRVLVSESGIRREADVRRLLDAGVDAILVGEGLLESGKVAGRIAEFSNRHRAAAPFSKRATAF
jgi:indole-3-glycerol phosphate synthase